MLRFHSLRVAEVRPDADDAVVVTLDVPEDLREVYRGLPGQHVVLRASIEGEEVRRTYSLVSLPGEPVLRIVVRVHRDGRMSRYLAEKVCVGESLDVMPPNGSFTPRSASSNRKTSVAFASGCGITPVFAIMRAVLAADADNRFILFYGNTGMSRAMCLEELLALKDRHMGRLALHFVMSREPQEVDLYNGRLDAERVRRVAQTLFDPGNVADYFICGPGKMSHEIGVTLRALGASTERIHVEHFYVDDELKEISAATATATSAPQEVARREAPIRATAATSVATGAQAEVTIVMDGRRRSFTMRMNDETVLEAAARAGLELPFSCRAGVCSTCRTKVVRGEVEMQQNYALEEGELQEGYILACQSRVKTPVLELDYDEK